MALRQATPDVSTAHAAKANAAPGTPARIQLWDLPVRVFHWSLLSAVAVAIVTGELGGTWMPVHGRAGIVIVGLVAFRLAWGFTGSTYARFAQFLPRPSAIVAYLQGRWQGVGHNPLGALSVLALLGLLAVQAGSGLLSNDDIAFSGHLTALIDEDLSREISGWHRQLATALFVLLGLHVAAIAFYTRVKHDNLVKPMVTGWKDVPPGITPPRPARPIALVLSVAIGLGAAYAASGIWIKPAAVAVPVESPAAAGKAPAF
jgi:cytochrome b